MIVTIHEKKHRQNIIFFFYNVPYTISCLATPQTLPFSSNSQPTLLIPHQLHSRRRKRQLPRLLNLSLKDDLISLLPHLRHKRLTRYDRAREANLDIAERT